MRKVKVKGLRVLCISFLVILSTFNVMASESLEDSKAEMGSHTVSNLIMNTDIDYTYSLFCSEKQTSEPYDSNSRFCKLCGENIEKYVENFLIENKEYNNEINENQVELSKGEEFTLSFFKVVRIYILIVVPFFWIIGKLADKFNSNKYF